MVAHGPAKYLCGAAVLLLTACSRVEPRPITVIDGDTVLEVRSEERVPLLILREAEIGLGPEDRILVNGLAAPIDQRSDSLRTLTIQLVRAVRMTLVTPDGEQSFDSSALTVGQALWERGLEIWEGDRLSPSAGTFLDGPVTVSYAPAREYHVSVGGTVIPIRSAADTVGMILAGAGLAPLGADYTFPAEGDAGPADGQIRLVRVREEFIWSLEPMPFSSESRDSAELEFGEEQVVQAGEPGLAQTRTRIRYEDGQEVSRADEEKTVIREPRPRITERGTRIVLKTAVVDGVTIQYWRAVEMYATSYSPCRSGVPGQCFSGTSLGLPVRKGVVAVDISFYNEMAGQQIFVSGYGPGVIADVGAGRIVEANLGIPRTRWVDLGYSDADWEEWGRYVTVYFLAPAPAAIPFVLQ